MPKLNQINKVAPNPAEQIGETIKKIGKAITALKATGINEKCVIDLLYLQTKLSRKTIKTLFNSLENLQKMYCERSE